MKLKRVMLLLFSLTTVSAAAAQESDSVRIADVAGFYLFHGKEPSPYPNFVQITLGIDDTIAFRTRAPGYVVFFSDTNIAPADTDVWCSIISIRLTRDSLSFTTAECLKEQYTFSGRWLLPFGTFDREGFPAVLEGVLSRYVFGKLHESKRVSFEYSPGC